MSWYLILVMSSTQLAGPFVTMQMCEESRPGFARATQRDPAELRCALMNIQPTKLPHAI